ncbi:hypothetical protein Ddye_026678 [Dipteronia dyeriana]|uniref:CCHC-type domain-containing protein n=1 Tax=Dipteronia dyeriana TaxID=168575 RepID=A0AAD9WQP6_9ROSI|nr:hypothetical protein Ddye_026678 [Dipteronia dyeriana]
MTNTVSFSSSPLPSVTIISSTFSGHDGKIFGGNTIISINIVVQAPLKLTATNYRSWKLQFQTLLIGFDLMGFVDGKSSCPPETITTGDTTAQNPEHHIWVRQDQLLLNAILGSITPSIIPFIASAKTAHDAWVALANTYAKPSRGHIIHLKGVLTNITKGTQSITEYMQHAKSITDELAMIDTLENPKELTVKITNGLGDEYKDISSAVRAHDTVISFEELHEKLLNSEALLKQEHTKTTSLPITANFTAKSSSENHQFNRHNNRSHTTQSNRLAAPTSNLQNFGNFSSSIPVNMSVSRPYHGFCQLCSEQGHMAKRCTTFNVSPVHGRSQTNQPRAQWQPRVNYTASNSTTTPEWLLDSGA